MKRRFLVLALIVISMRMAYNKVLPYSLDNGANRRKLSTTDASTQHARTRKDVDSVAAPVQFSSLNLFRLIKTGTKKDVETASAQLSALYMLLYKSGDWAEINKHINSILSESMKREKGRGCIAPNLNPFAPEMMKFISDKVPKIICKQRDWVECHHNNCRVTTKTLLLYNDIKCNYSKIIFNNDFDIKTSKEVVMLEGNSTYSLTDTDQVRVTCVGRYRRTNVDLTYKGVVMGIRHEISERPAEPKSKYNVLIIGFDSVSHNYVQRRMPNLYRALKDEFGAVILETYNIVGDGTPQALLPIFSGMAEPELPEVRKNRQKFGQKHTVDEYPFIFKMLKKQGTAYFEDMPWVGTWQYRMVGFKTPPADHYLRPLTVHHTDEKYCIFGTPVHEIMLNLTEQVMSIDKKKKFVFTFSGDLTHDDYNMVKHADHKTVNLLRRLRDGGKLNDTLVIVMGDHGSRFGTLRATLQGKQEERMPLMSFIVPKSIQDARPDAFENLKKNTKILTTPFDIHSTLLDLLDLKEHRVEIKVPGSTLPRSMSLFEPIPPSRSCSEAGVEPHWCVCLQWFKLSSDDLLYKRVANYFVDHINMLTETFRQKCVKRSLTSVDHVLRQIPNDKLLKYVKAADNDGFVGKYGKAIQYSVNYQVKLTVGPGVGVFEATLTHNNKTDKLSLLTSAISRINAYNDEPKCISNIRPDLNMFCYCALSED